MIRKGTVFVSVLFVIWLIGLGIFNYQINHVSVDDKTKTDAIVVLTGGRHRLLVAMQLLNQGMADKLFISGVEKGISLHDLEKKNAIKLNGNKEIFLDRVATNTSENAREVSFWITQRNVKSIRLVTSNYHLFRSLVELRRWNKKTEVILHPVFSEKVETSWWKSFYSFYFLASEYNKFLFAWLRAFICRV